jgi:hypothetical protein
MTVRDRSLNIKAITEELELLILYEVSDILCLNVGPVAIYNIPVRQEKLPLSTQNAVANQNDPLSYIASLPILNDCRGLIERYGEQNSNLLFTNQGEFRWIDLLSDKPLYRLSFDFRWQKTDQSLEQLKLEPEQSISIKLYFKSLHEKIYQILKNDEFPELFRY